MLKIIVLFSILVTQVGFAVEVIDEGQPAPYKGYLFNPEEEKQLRVINERKLKLEDLAIKQDEKIASMERVITLQSDRIDLLRGELGKEEPLSNWGRFGYFALGVVTTGAMFYLTAKTIDSVK